MARDVRRRREMHTGFEPGNLGGGKKSRLEDANADARIISKLIIKKPDLRGLRLRHERDQWQVLVNMVMDIWSHIMRGIL